MSLDSRGGQLVRYRCFVAVADAGGFSNAARTLGCSQSSVSRQVAALEEEVGLTLVKRTKRSSNVSLTPAGEALLPRARAICSSVGEFLDSAETLGNDGSGTIVVVSALGRFPRWLLDSFAAVRPDFPDLHLKLRTADSRRAQDDVLSHVADMAIARNPSLGGMLKRYLLEDELVIVFRRDILDTLPQKEGLEQLFRRPLAIASDGLQEFRQAVGAARYAQLDVPVVSRDMGALLNLAKIGESCSILWRSAFDDSPELCAMRVDAVRHQYVCSVLNASGASKLATDFAGAVARVLKERLESQVDAGSNERAPLGEDAR